MSVEGFEVKDRESGVRLDLVVSGRLNVSRSLVQRLLRDGGVLLDGEPASASHKVRAGEQVAVSLPESELLPEGIPVPIVFEGEHLLVVDKPAGLVVHPGAGNRSGTLVNALLDHGISGGGDAQRPGVVHRLDRDTSGLLVLAKNEPTYSGLVAALKARRVSRVYRAIAAGTGLPETGTVDSPIGRDPENPTLMTAGIGKNAITHFEVLAETAAHTMLRVRLETGRTHQIRVHLSAIGHPIHADPLYGTPVPGERLWLHAERLAFKHPMTGDAMSFESAIPEDLAESADTLGFERGSP